MERARSLQIRMMELRQRMKERSEQSVSIVELVPLTERSKNSKLNDVEGTGTIPSASKLWPSSQSDAVHGEEKKV